MLDIHLVKMAADVISPLSLRPERDYATGTLLSLSLRMSPSSRNPSTMTHGLSWM